MRAISHKNAAEKTMIILVLAEALRAAALVGDPAPQVARLWDWMSAPLRVGDLVVETSTGHRGPDPSRVGVVLKISRHRSPYERVTEILLLDPPCGKTRCRNQKCIHRRRWNNAAFVRVPATAAQLTEALGCNTRGKASGIDRDGLIDALAGAGFKIKAGQFIVRKCLNCEQEVTLIYDERLGYHRETCTCGTHCTTGACRDIEGLVTDESYDTFR